MNDSTSRCKAHLEILFQVPELFSVSQDLQELKELGAMLLQEAVWNGDLERVLASSSERRASVETKEVEAAAKASVEFVRNVLILVCAVSHLE